MPDCHPEFQTLYELLEIHFRREQYLITVEVLEWSFDAFCCDDAVTATVIAKALGKSRKTVYSISKRAMVCY